LGIECAVLDSFCGGLKFLNCCDATESLLIRVKDDLIQNDLKFLVGFQVHIKGNAMKLNEAE